jgi:hypothetical protein
MFCRKMFYDTAHQITNPKEYIYNLQKVIDVISCVRPLFYAIFYNGDPSVREILDTKANEPWIENWDKLNDSFGNLFTLCETNHWK